MKSDVFGARRSIEAGGREITLYDLSALEKAGVVPSLDRLPFSIRVLLEAVLRSLDGELVTEEDVRRLASWDAQAPPEGEVPYKPARVILQDFTGVPAVVDLASMRAAYASLAEILGRFNQVVGINRPLQPLSSYRLVHDEAASM